MQKNDKHNGKVEDKVKGQDWKQYINLETGGNLHWEIFYDLVWEFTIQFLKCFCVADVVFSEVDTDNDYDENDEPIKTYSTKKAV